MPDLGQTLAPVSASAIICTSCGHAVSVVPRDPLATIGPEDSGAIQSCNLAPGTLLAGRYRIRARIGHGGMGEVYQADDVTLGQVVALKFLPPHLQADRAALARFHREVSLARRISHPNVCRVFDIGYAEGLAFLTMEYIAGDDLRALQERIGRLPYAKALEIARQLCSGVAAAHDEGVLHRDLKPANILLDRRGHVRITDFGLAAPFGDVDLVAVGTPVYMAPEQLRREPTSVRTDLYSLGLVLREIFTGEAPSGVALQSGRLSIAPGGVSSTVERAILQCLEPDPAKRPPSASAVADALTSNVPAVGRGAASGPELQLEQKFGWLFFSATLMGLAIFLIMALRALVDVGVFDRRIPNPPAIVFTWVWCISAQSFLAFLALAYLLKQKLPGR